MNINQKHQHFWSNEFLSPLEKRKLRDSMRFPVFSEYLLWFFSVVVVIVLEFTAIEHSRFIYKQSWPDFAKRIYKSGFFLLCSCGYYVGNSHHAYYVHTILHSCYQMKLLAAYMKREMKRYRTIPLGSKIHCESYQREAREILMRSIRQYQRLKKLAWSTDGIFIFKNVLGMETKRRLLTDKLQFRTRWSPFLFVLSDFTASYLYLREPSRKFTPAN